ncbi:histidine phosphatase family protein [uncultured Algibacter sp.]|uniref:SixA phosphatase family protein n=1 Tax=uncultured Algibacter sp. TaxID=298659 RepID=UPI0026046F9E|nr:histidine phosphatase family protein [uncultured Algibacter sp.]
MKRLILIRHAKSSWEYDVIDHERPLITRGLKDANLVSNHLISSIISIDSVICSDAKRTIQTADIFIAGLNIDPEIVRYNHNLYDFVGKELINVIKNCDNSVHNLMIFGHNHAITSFVNAYGSEHIDNVPTCGVTIIEFDIFNWIHLEQGKTIKILFPRDLK